LFAAGASNAAAKPVGRVPLIEVRASSWNQRQMMMSSLAAPAGSANEGEPVDADVTVPSERIDGAVIGASLRLEAP
jgi:hypothetical protein